MTAPLAFSCMYEAFERGAALAAPFRVRHPGLAKSHGRIGAWLRKLAPQDLDRQFEEVRLEAAGAESSGAPVGSAWLHRGGGSIELTGTDGCERSDATVRRTATSRRERS